MTNFSNDRKDGRAFNALRPFRVEWDPMAFSLSSLIVHTGKTSVLCSVCFQEGVPKWLQGKGKGWLSAEYRLLPGSTPQRQQREITHLSGRTQEIQRLIGRSLRSVVDLEAFGERTFLIDCDVIQADAGTRTAAITGAWMALNLACKRLLLKGDLQQNPLSKQVAAVSVGLLDDNILLDLDYLEDSVIDVDLNVVMDSDGRLLEIQGTAEKKPFSREKLSEMLDLAEEGLKLLSQKQMSALEKQD